MGVTQAPASLGAQMEIGDSVLVLSPSFADETTDACVDLLTPVSPDRTLTLWVTLVDSPTKRVEPWNDHGHGHPVDAAVIDVGDSLTKGEGFQPTIAGNEIPVTSISSPLNLTKLGVEIVDRLERWRGHSNAQIVLCFHSLSTFLQYLEIEEAFRFIHALTAEISRAGAMAHFHMDPAMHDDQTVSTLLPLFRGLAEFDDGEWMFRTR